LIRYGKSFRKSSIRTYLACPRAYEYKYEMGFAPETEMLSSVAGRAAHKVIWALHRTGRFDADIRKWFERAFEQEFEAREGDISWPKDPSIVRREIADEYVEMLDGYAKDERNRGAHLLLNEAMFHVELSMPRSRSRYPIDGRIDQVRRLDGRLAVIDIKSGKERPTEMDVLCSTELAIYAYGVWKGLGVAFEFPIVIGYWHLRDYIPYQQNQYAEFISTGRKARDPETGRMRNEVKPNPRFEHGYKKGQARGPNWYWREITEADLWAMLEDVAQVYRSIRMGIFPRREGESYCENLCEYRTYCRMDHEVSRMRWQIAKTRKKKG